jgi:hypothetical protein
MILPRDSRMMPPLSSEIIPSGPRLASTSARRSSASSYSLISAFAGFHGGIAPSMTPRLRNDTTVPGARLPALIRRRPVRGLSRRPSALGGLGWRSPGAASSSDHERERARRRRVRPRSSKPRSAVLDYVAHHVFQLICPNRSCKVNGREFFSRIAAISRQGTAARPNPRMRLQGLDLT